MNSLLQESQRILSPECKPGLPLLKEELDVFAPKTLIFGCELGNVTFKNHLAFFDTRNFKTDLDGLTRVKQHLNGVEKIDRLRLTQFSRGSELKIKDVNDFMKMTL